MPRPSPKGSTCRSRRSRKTRYLRAIPHFLEKEGERSAEAQESWYQPAALMMAFKRAKDITGQVAEAGRQEARIEDLDEKPKAIFRRYMASKLAKQRRPPGGPTLTKLRTRVKDTGGLSFTREVHQPPARRFQTGDIRNRYSRRY